MNLFVFRSVQVRKGKSHERKLLIIYSVIAIGFSSLWTALMYVLNSTNTLIQSNKWKPHLAKFDHFCWFDRELNRLNKYRGSS